LEGLIWKIQQFWGKKILLLSLFSLIVLKSTHKLLTSHSSLNHFERVPEPSL